jgi:hypothetical protein
MNESPGGGTRDNGLRAGNYVAVGDVDPRIADSLLESLRERGIAAYAVPATGTVGGAMETRLPSRPLDRLFVDDQRLDQARDIVRADNPPPDTGSDTAPDFEASWQQVLTSLQSNPTHLVSPWPERENLTLEEREQAYDEQAAAAADPEDEHFVPPPAPPLPRLRRATWTALATMAFAVAVMVTDVGGRTLDVLAFLVFVAAAASLVYNMRPGPPSDDDSDDGAVV